MSPQLANEIKTATRHVSLAALESQSGKKNLELSTYHPAGQSPQRMVFIFLSEWAAKYSVRIFYDFEDAARFSGINASDTGKATQKRLNDFVMELANSMAGAMIRAFEDPSRPLGISLPVSNRAVEGVVLAPETSGREFHDAWVLKTADGTARMVFTFTLEVVDRDAAATIQPKQVTVSAAESEMEFL